MPRHERILGIALVLAVALPPYLTAPLRARADIIDDLLDAAGDFVPQYKYLKEAYDFYGKYVAGQPVIPNVQAAINAAKTQIVAELDALAAADVGISGHRQLVALAAVGRLYEANRSRIEREW